MEKVDVLIVGGGPAGLSAAIEAAKYGANVLVVDENRRAGGQLFKQIHKFFGSKRHSAGTRGIDIGTNLLKEVEALNIKVMLNTVVYGIFREGVGVAFPDGSGAIIQAKKVILATGASENPLTFPGWTLPGVVGAGAIQTMINVERVQVGKRVLMIGSGNVGLIVCYQLLLAGVEVAGIVEAAPGIGGYGVHSAKVKRAGVPIYTSHTVVRALPNADSTGIVGAVIAQVNQNFEPVPGTERVVEADCIGIAVGLTPSIELASIPGVEFTFKGPMGGHIPMHDNNMRTTKDGLYVAGDVAGVEEASTAMEEGKLAGIAAAEALGLIMPDEAKHKKQEVWQSLDQLRTGPFGEGRRKLKQAILEEMTQWGAKKDA